MWPSHSKWLSELEQRICIKFYVKFECSSAETIWMIQKATAMGNWWLAASSWQCAFLCIVHCAECFGKTSNHPGNSAPLQARFGALWLLAFPKTKGKKFQTVDEIQENIIGQQMATGKTMGSQRTYFEEDWGTIVLCTIYLVSSSINASIFHIT